MHYEVHITVIANDIDKFKQTCEALNVKPIIIETERENVFLNQVMTSSKHNDNQPRYTAMMLGMTIERLGFKVLRIKIEKQPDGDLTDHLYYETHFRLLLPKNYNTTALRNACKELNFHFSKNLLKRSDVVDYQMITYRSHTMDFSEFKKKIKLMKNVLYTLDITADKIEIEDCIFDVNESVDNKWFGK